MSIRAASKHLGSKLAATSDERAASFNNARLPTFGKPTELAESAPITVNIASYPARISSRFGCGQSTREERQVPTLLRGGWPAGRAPNIQDTGRGVLIRVSLRERNSAIGHDWAVPVTAAAG